MFLKLCRESFERTSKVICSEIPHWVCSPLFFFISFGAKEERERRKRCFSA